MVGQITFGILADRYGRRKVYGLELVVIIGASLGFATASSGVNNSMSLIAFLIFWRAVSTLLELPIYHSATGRLIHVLYR